jgi:hypothetical protein
MAPTRTFERRRRGIVPRVARLTFPARRAADDFLSGFPCTLIGHKWVEIPQSRRRKIYIDFNKIRFACSRCRKVADFTV